jgi:cell division protein FtsX
MLLLIKLTSGALRSAPLTHALGALSTGALLFLLGALGWSHQALVPVSERLQQDQVLTVYLDASIKSGDEAPLVDRIRQAVGAHAVRVDDLKFVDAAAFLEEVRPQSPDLAERLLDLTPDLSSLVPRYVSVSGRFPESIGDRVRGLSGVDAVETSHHRFRAISGSVEMLLWILRILALGVGCALFFVLLQQSRMIASALTESSSLMRVMGASQAAIVFPRTMAALSLGVLSGLLASGAWIAIARPAVQQIQELSPVFSSIVSPSISWALVLIGAGAGVSVVSSLIANDFFHSRAR